MPSYFLEFEAHIDERKRPENFPSSVFVQSTFQVENDEQLKRVYNDYFMALVKNPGLTFYRSGESIDSTRVRFDQRVYVPWHMITHMHGKATIITPNVGPRDLAAPAIEPSSNLSLPELKEPVQ